MFTVIVYDTSLFIPLFFRLVPSCETDPQDFFTICHKGIFRKRFGVVTFKSLDELEVSYEGYMKLKNVLNVY